MFAKSRLSVYVLIIQSPSQIGLLITVLQGSGQIGSHILKHLVDVGKHEITVLSRNDGSANISGTPHVTVARVDYEKEDSLVEALRGHDFLIITLSARAPPTLHSTIVRAAASAGVPYIMPNYFSYGLGARGVDLSELANFNAAVDDVAKTPGVDYVALVCGIWYEFSLAMGEPWLGFRIRDRTVTMYGDGERRVSMSTWEQCGRAVASLVSLPLRSEGNSDASIETWKNEGVYISSFLISQRDILNSLHRVLGTTDDDWNITYERVEERYQKGTEELQAGSFLGFAKAMYAKVFMSKESDYETGHELDNGALALPKEDLDEATRKAVKMAEGEMGDLGY
jgi:hypothetical protein